MLGHDAEDRGEGGGGWKELGGEDHGYAVVSEPCCKEDGNLFFAAQLFDHAEGLSAEKAKDIKTDADGKDQPDLTVSRMNLRSKGGGVCGDDRNHQELGKG